MRPHHKLILVASLLSLGCDLQSSSNQPLSDDAMLSPTGELPTPESTADEFREEADERADEIRQGAEEMADRVRSQSSSNHASEMAERIESKGDAVAENVEARGEFAAEAAERSE